MNTGKTAGGSMSMDSVLSIKLCYKVVGRGRYIFISLQFAKSSDMLTPRGAGSFSVGSVLMVTEAGAGFTVVVGFSSPFFPVVVSLELSLSRGSLFP